MKGVVINLDPGTQKMLRNICIATAALAMSAASAQAETIHISTVGKTSEQIKTEVFKAARSLCAMELWGASFRFDEERACVAATVKETFAQAPDPALRFARQ